MPAVVTRHRLVGHRLRLVDGECDLGHRLLLLSQRLPRVFGIGMTGRGPMSFSTSPNPTHHAQIPSAIATQPDRLSRKLLVRRRDVDDPRQHVDDHEQQEREERRQVDVVRAVGEERGEDRPHEQVRAERVAEPAHAGHAIEADLRPEPAQDHRRREQEAGVDGAERRPEQVAAAELHQPRDEHPERAGAERDGHEQARVDVEELRVGQPQHEDREAEREHAERYAARERERRRGRLRRRQWWWTWRPPSLSSRAVL